MIRPILLLPVLAVGTFLLTSERQGLVVLLDDSVEIVVRTTSDEAGFGAIDGLRWHGDSLFLADEGSSVVIRLAPSGESVRLATGTHGVKSPEDLVLAEDGTVYFTDDDAGGLWSIGRDKHVQQIAGPADGLRSTEGLAIAPNGNLVVGDGVAHAVFEVTPAGVVRILIGPEQGLEKPESLVFNTAGDLFIADNGRNVVHRWSHGRLEPWITARDGLTHPESLCFLGDDLYLTDDESGKLARFTPDGGLQTVAVFAGRLKALQGITPGPDGSLLLSVQDLERNRGLILQMFRRQDVAERWNSLVRTDQE